MTIEIDHIGLGVADYQAARAFYIAALKPLGMGLVMEFTRQQTGHEDSGGFGTPGRPFIWISATGKTTPHVHLALRANSRAQVDAFYAAAIAAGGKDNGGPGVREMYHPHYYGAFVLDPEGHNLEAVVHTPPGAVKAARKPAKKASAKSARRPARKAAPANKAAKRKPAKGKKKR
jgi:catechol 2,3-dioxygenase-like lactoylglutathione lyase family enzyme